MISAVLNMALADEVISYNPTLGVFRERRTRKKRQQERARIGEQVKAMTREERNAFLAVAARHRPEVYPAFMLMALAGLRLGETLGLRWGSVDFEGKTLRIHEQLVVDATKSGMERTVDMAAPLENLLRSLKTRRLEANMAASEGGDISALRVVFPDLPEKPDQKNHQAVERRVRRAMAWVLKEAGLSAHFTPHSLRHTFCSLLISASVSPVYVQQQAGHASVKMTVDVYGSWFAVEAPGAMDRLSAGAPGAIAVTNHARTGNAAGGPDAQVLPPTGTYGGGTATRPSPG